MENLPRTREQYRQWWSENTDVPYGRCWCGCNGETTIQKKTRASRLKFSGEPIRYLKGHNHRFSPVDYIATDCGYETPCWIWQLHLARGGYGGGNKGRRAHRVAWERQHGPIPPGMQVHHLCRQKACQRPSHMTLLSQKDHGTVHGWLMGKERAALVEAGKNPSRTYAEVGAEFGVSKYVVSRIMIEHGIRRGRGAGRKVNTEDIQAMCRMLREGRTVASVARQFGVSRRLVGMYRDGELSA